MCILSDTANFGGSFPHKISIFCNLSVGAHSVRPILLVLHGIDRCTTLPVNNRFFVHNNALLLPCRIKIHFAARSIFLSEGYYVFMGVEIGAIHIVGFTSFVSYNTLLDSDFLCELRLCNFYFIVFAVTWLCALL